MKVVLNNIRYRSYFESGVLLPISGSVLEVEAENINDAAERIDHDYMYEGVWLLENYLIEVQE